ncbi:hypothetical protein, unlikely [Trypanosoma brucei gambiense DAL972]|uniref:Uncharacterized protein n=1 Tax=Trypanosoma brucei gambiense (strain MHOM/CI/86/DAL972) TaxID=679716 RepID=D0A8C1_TRYB9|nr:hypothetical protein, unlikely [Trypanosoma brucei gambiense DAL972]CBH17922.1 hypothetical protein, unlikely [Trypanosoma brucei gambiense DAL972]|eukprot:XP_011780186.1 hypothetical protein, unlikely [Trypanosoma brucei gambiense DAL972]
MCGRQKTENAYREPCWRLSFHNTMGTGGRRNHPPRQPLHVCNEDRLPHCHADHQKRYWLGPLMWMEASAGEYNKPRSGHFAWIALKQQPQWLQNLPYYRCYTLQQTGALVCFSCYRSLLFPCAVLYYYSQMVGDKYRSHKVCSIGKNNISGVGSIGGVNYTCRCFQWGYAYAYASANIYIYLFIFTSAWLCNHGKCDVRFTERFRPFLSFPSVSWLQQELSLSSRGGFTF